MSSSVTSVHAINLLKDTDTFHFHQQFYCQVPPECSPTPFSLYLVEYIDFKTPKPEFSFLVPFSQLFELLPSSKSLFHKFSETWNYFVSEASSKSVFMVQQGQKWVPSSMERLSALRKEEEECFFTQKKDSSSTDYSKLDRLTEQFTNQGTFETSAPLLSIPGVVCFFKFFQAVVPQNSLPAAQQRLIHWFKTHFIPGFQPRITSEHTFKQFLFQEYQIKVFSFPISSAQTSSQVSVKKEVIDVTSVTQKNEPSFQCPWTYIATWCASFSGVSLSFLELREKQTGLVSTFMLKDPNVKIFEHPSSLLSLFELVPCDSAQKITGIAVCVSKCPQYLISHKEIQAPSFANTLNLLLSFSKLLILPMKIHIRSFKTDKEVSTYVQTLNGMILHPVSLSNPNKRQQTDSDAEDVPSAKRHCDGTPISSATCNSKAVYLSSSDRISKSIELFAPPVAVPSAPSLSSLSSQVAETSTSTSISTSSEQVELVTVTPTSSSSSSSSLNVESSSHEASPSLPPADPQSSFFEVKVKLTDASGSFVITKINASADMNLKVIRALVQKKTQKVHFWKFLDTETDTLHPDHEESFFLSDVCSSLEYPVLFIQRN